VSSARSRPAPGWGRSASYQSLLDGGTKPNLAKLTIARQIASIVLSMWRSGEEYEPRKLEQSK
jgi:hypothetical protein